MKSVGSAVAVERIFSGDRDTIGLRRVSLQAETIQTLMFVKANLFVQDELLHSSTVSILSSFSPGHASESRGHRFT